MTIRPLQDRILVRRAAAEEKSPGGIIIPDQGKEKPVKGEVIATGNGKVWNDRIVPLDVKVGDHVLFTKYAGTEVKIEGVDHIIMREDDILGVIDEGKRAKKAQK